jgi:hypothetical protein
MLPVAGNVAKQASDHPRLPALARFAERLPFTTLATNDFRDGAYRMTRDVALTCREVRPDPPEWITALRLDVDCPCPGSPHRKADGAKPRRRLGSMRSCLPPTSSP